MLDCRTGFELTSIYTQAGQSTSIDSYKFEAFQSHSSGTSRPMWPFSFSFFFFLERANTYHRVQTEGLVVQLYVGHFVNSCTVLCIAGSFK